MSERLLEAWEKAEKQIDGSPRITPTGVVSKGGPEEQLIPIDTEERLVYARRIIAARCLHGVDVNPLAAEMAKLSLWLLTLAKNKPFEFLDHAIRCGDSLVGLHDLEQLRHYSLNPDDDDAVLFGGPFEETVDEAIRLRMKLEDMPVNTVEDVEAQEKLLAESEEKIARLRCSADLLVAAEFWGENAKDKEEKVRHAAVISGHYVGDGPTEEFKKKADKELRSQKMFHWPLEFPEVIVIQNGFDAFVGNPPFMGGQKITGNLGNEYRDYVVDNLANGLRGSADLCSYFFLRAGSLLREASHLGFIATNTISQGATREVGLEQLATCGFTIPCAVPSRQWPGIANLEISEVWLRRGSWSGCCILNNDPVSNITPYLTVPGAIHGKPFRLVENNGGSCQGTTVLGLGFVLDENDAQALIEEDSKNRDVLFLFMNGEDLNSHPQQLPSRWVINFFDWPLNRHSSPQHYIGPVADDYPRCLAIIEKNVRPQREENRYSQRARQFWWLYERPRLDLYSRIASADKVLVCSEVTKHLCLVFVATGTVFTANLDVFPHADYGIFAILQSSQHDAWARFYSAHLESRLKYSPGNAHDTYPFAVTSKELEAIGEQYHAHRRNVMAGRNEGLTQTYNRFHDSNETSGDIRELRELHVEMDQVVAASYGWDHLDLDHGFHETKLGLRYTISETARREVLQRLLKLNHERYAEEEAQGLHDKKKKTKKKVTKMNSAKKKSTEQEPTLFE